MQRGNLLHPYEEIRWVLLIRSYVGNIFIRKQHNLPETYVKLVKREIALDFMSGIRRSFQIILISVENGLTMISVRYLPNRNYCNTMYIASGTECITFA